MNIYVVLDANSWEFSPRDVFVDEEMAIASAGGVQLIVKLDPAARNDTRPIQIMANGKWNAYQF